MENTKDDTQKEKYLQWHPAFYAAAQIELREEIDTFYKIYGYACFYKADTGGVDAVAIEEMTITLFGREYPRKLIKHLKEVRGYRVEKQEEGIYYADGDMLPIQILVGKQLSSKENLWLRGLTNELESYEILEKLVRDYQEHSENVWYQSALDIIVRANEKMKQGLEQFGKLTQCLLEDGRIEELKRATEDVTFQKQLMKEYKIL